MSELLPSIERLIEQFRHIPSVGKKTAVRMAFSILDYSDEEAQDLADAIIEAKKQVTQCPVCFNLSERGESCSVCSDSERDHSVICVVEDYKAVMAFERVRGYRGVYHVLHGVISPLDRIGPEQLRIAELLERISDGGVSEVIIATNPDVEGEATAVYLTKLIRPTGIKVSRLAYGIPVGGDLEYVDVGTLERAIIGRRDPDYN